MKSAYYEKNGPASDVLIVEDRARPEPAAGEVLVQIHRSGVNPSDVKTRAARPLAGDYVIPQSDGAGVITAVGDGVSEQRIGQRVWIWNGQWQRADGTAAEYIALPSDQAVQLPDNASFDEGACAGIPLLTAIQAVEFAKACDAKTILVTGAGNAVGHYATQVAVRNGMTVIGTASPRRADLVHEAGAATVVDYRADGLTDIILAANDGKGVDAIIDMDFSSSVSLLRAGVLAPHGTLICYGSNDMNDIASPFRELLYMSLKMNFFLVYELTPSQRETALAIATEVLASGTLQTKIDSHYSLDQIATAHEKVETGTAIGNVLLDIV
jgi:NADPH:quinone reductase